MSLAKTLSPPNVTPESLTDAGERHRRWLHRGCWGGSLIVVFMLLAVISYPTLIRWRLESRGWKINYYESTKPPLQWLPRILEPWFSEHASATIRKAPMTADDVTLVAQLPRVWVLNADEATISEPTFEAIRHIESLERLLIRASKLDDHGIQKLPQAKRLRFVRLGDVTLTAAQVKAISSCAGLEVLHLENVQVADDDLADLANLSQLKNFGAYPSRIGDQGLQHLTQISNLHRLVLASKNITDAGLRHLHHLPLLEKLQLEDCQLTDRGIKDLVASCRGLKSLQLDCPLLTDAVLTDLADLPSLVELGLWQTPVFAGQFSEFKRYPALRKLSLSQAQVGAISSADWEELAQVNPKLETWLR